jgi:iron(III) transport system substrate-binding protein
MRRYLEAVLILVVLEGLVGCGGESQPRVVVYTALDQEFSEPILQRYQRQTGITIVGKYDIESTKTVGLTNQILAERDAPRCDLFWNNEIVNTLRLKKQGLLEPFTPPNATDFPETFRDKHGTWYGFAARARILIVNTQRVAETDRPTSILNLIDPRWRGRIGLAKPLFGTTATHAACLYTIWGDEKARQFFDDLKANEAQILSGNRDVARAVGRGELAFGLTDTDDALVEAAEGSPVAIVYPDRQSDQLGTLFIPNTVALIRGAPHRRQAEALAAFLLSPEVETALAQGPSGQIPLNARLNVPTRVETPRTVHAMKVDFEEAAGRWDEVAADLARRFSSP